MLSEMFPSKSLRELQESLFQHKCVAGAVDNLLLGCEEIEVRKKLCSA